MTPRASWAPVQRRLRWQLPPLSPGGGAVVRAIFSHDGTISAPAMAAAGRGATATLSFRGPPGKGTLSGVALESGDASGGKSSAGSGLVPGEQSFRGWITAQPEEG